MHVPPRADPPGSVSSPSPPSWPSPRPAIPGRSSPSRRSRPARSWTGRRASACIPSDGGAPVTIDVKKVDLPTVTGIVVDAPEGEPKVVTLDLREVTQVEVRSVDGWRTAFLVTGIVLGTLLLVAGVAAVIVATDQDLLPVRLRGRRRRSPLRRGRPTRARPPGRPSGTTSCPCRRSGSARRWSSPTRPGRRSSPTSPSWSWSTGPRDGATLATHDARLLLVGDSRPPLSATDLEGRDVLPLLRDADGQAWQTDLDEVSRRPSPPVREGLVLTFPTPPGGGPMALELDAGNTPWLDVVFGRFFALLGEEPRDVPRRGGPARVARVLPGLARARGGRPARRGGAERELGAGRRGADGGACIPPPVRCSTPGDECPIDPGPAERRGRVPRRRPGRHRARRGGRSPEPAVRADAGGAAGRRGRPPPALGNRRELPGARRAGRAGRPGVRDPAHGAGPGPRRLPPHLGLLPRPHATPVRALGGHPLHGCATSRAASRSSRWSSTAGPGRSCPGRWRRSREPSGPIPDGVGPPGLGGPGRNRTARGAPRPPGPGPGFGGPGGPRAGLRRRAAQGLPAPGTLGPRRGTRLPRPDHPGLALPGPGPVSRGGARTHLAHPAWPAAAAPGDPGGDTPLRPALPALLRLGPASRRGGAARRRDRRDRRGALPGSGSATWS